MGLLDLFRRRRALPAPRLDGPARIRDLETKLDEVVFELEQARADGALRNAASGLGTSIDPRQQTSISFGRQLGKSDVDLLMRFEWGPRKFVEELPHEATRKWVKLSVESDMEDGAKRVLDLLEDVEARQKLRQALIWERQYGGSAILIGAVDGCDLEEPLDLANVSELRFLHVVSRWKIQNPGLSDLEDDPASPRLGLPKTYRLVESADTARGGLTKPIHHTRMIVFPGWRPVEPLNRWEWGLPVLECFWPAWRDYASSMGHGLGVGHRMNETRYKVKNLRTMLMGPDKKSFLAAVQEIALIRSTFRMLMVDTEDEIEDASLNFTGMADLIKIARENVAASSGLSLQRFFGLTREGLSDKDEGASERDDGAVSSYQQDRLLAPINRLVEVALSATKQKEAKTWQVTFQPLREETPKGRADRQYTEAQTAEIYNLMDAVRSGEVRETLRADETSPYQLEEGDGIESDEIDDPDAEVELLKQQARLTSSPSGAPSAGGLDAAGLDAIQLNGAQMKAVADTIKDVAAGNISRESGVAMIVTSLGFDRATANSLLGPTSFEPRVAPPPPTPVVPTESGAGEESGS